MNTSFPKISLIEIQEKAQGALLKLGHSTNDTADALALLFHFLHNNRQKLVEDLNNLSDFLKEKLNIKKRVVLADIISSEFLNKLLSDTSKLPLLIGINPDLDKLIEEKLKA